MSCLVRIENYYHSFTASERKIADFLLQNAESAVKMNIHQLAAEINVAPSSITRFVRRLDYKSFSEMRIELVRGVDVNSIDNFNEVLKWSHNRDELCSHFVQNMASVCMDTLDLNGMQKLKDAAQIIQDAKVVFLFGVGASALIAQDLQQKLMKLRKRCIYHLDGNFGAHNAMMAQKEDVVIAVSYGGITKEVNLAVRYAKASGCRVIAITRYGRTPLSEMADISLSIPNVEQVTKIAAIFSRYAQLFIVDVLFLNLAQTTEEDPAKMLSQYRSLFEPLKE